MGLMDRLRGRRPEQEQNDASAAAAAAVVSPSLDLGRAEAATPSLGGGTGGHNEEGLPGFSVSSQDATRLYNPYEGLGVALDRRGAGGAAAFRLPHQPEFLFSEEALVHKRSWSENLTYYTGAGYLVGAIVGGARGSANALSAPVAVAGVDSSRLRVNALLNTGGRMGRSAGNSLGVLGLLFASFESFIGYMADGQVPDEACTLGAGALTGAMYRSVRGPKQAAAAAAVGTIGAALLLSGRKFINPGL